MTSREDNRRLAEAYNEAMGIGGTNLHDELTDDPDGFSSRLRSLSGPNMPPLRSLWRWIHNGQGEGLLRGPHLAPEGTRAVVRVQPPVWPRGRL